MSRKLMSKDTFIMTTTIGQLNKECFTDAHTEHLCYITSQGFHLTNEPEYRALIAEPKYRCNHCHRTARKETNLCEPVSL
jgi:hypothetical protein